MAVTRNADTRRSCGDSVRAAGADGPFQRCIYPVGGDRCLATFWCAAFAPWVGLRAIFALRSETAEWFRAKITPDHRSKKAQARISESRPRQSIRRPGQPSSSVAPSSRYGSSPLSFSSLIPSAKKCSAPRRIRFPRAVCRHTTTSPTGRSRTTATRRGPAPRNGCGACAAGTSV